jgi:FxsC-like protein
VDRRGGPAPSRTSVGTPDAQVRVDRSPYFFLSHAPGEDDIYISRFFRDLSAAVRAVLGSDSPDEVGYLDPGTSEPPHWPADAQAALASCRTFVALCSTRYFLSSHCGRTLSVFAGRLRDYRRQTGDRADGVIPVLWSDGGRPAAEDLDLWAGSTPLPDEVRVLIRLTSHRDAYRDYVRSLAERIVQTARRHRLPHAPMESSVGTAPDAFARDPRRFGDDADQPTRVSVAVVAGTRDQMRPIRRNVGPYGDRREDWAPYGPTVPQPVTERAVALAAARRLGAEVVPLEALAERISAARTRNEIVVLLVDAWATQLGQLRDTLREVNRRDDDTAAVLVPINFDDPETAANRSVLRMAVLAAFGDRQARRDLTFHPEVSTVDRFDTDLAVAIVEAQSRLLRSVPPALSAPRPRSRPILGGP